jgi:4,5-DOPA dioxygenase extradiol
MQGGHSWANDFDETVKQLILAGDHEKLIHYEKLGQAARLAIPTNEHYLPLLYILGLDYEQASLRFFNEQTVAGALSMRSLLVI